MKRRQFLRASLPVTAIAVTSGVAAGGMTASAQPADPVIVLCEKWWALTGKWESYWQAHDEESAEEDAIWGERSALFDRLANTTPTSVQGAVDLLKVLQRDQREGLEEGPAALIATVLSGLETIGA